MDNRPNVAAKINRFAWAIDGLPVGPRAPFDVDLYRFQEIAVTPTVGAIIPAWLLIIPQIEACCFANLPHWTRRQISVHISSLRAHMNVFEGQSFLFEHGAKYSGSSIGCGVDQAHAHLIRFQGDLIGSAIVSDRQLTWFKINTFDPWSEVNRDREYYLITDFMKAYVTYPSKPKSQYFRQLIARDLGRAAEWDYRVFEYEKNARDTIKLLSNTAARKSAA